MNPNRISRRSLGRLLVGGSGVLALGAPSLRARALSAGDRRFLFVFARGGWDPSYVFAPAFDSEHVDMPDVAEAAEAHGIAYVAGATRPSVASFFENYGAQSCIINGIEVPSVAHERCIRLTLTGLSRVGSDDVGAILGAHASGSPLMPCAVLSGPSFAGSYGGAVVRVGENAQLSELLDGSALDRMDEILPLLHSDVESAVDAFVRSRALAQAEAQRSTGQARRYLENNANMLDRLAGVGAQLEGIELGSDSPSETGSTAVALLAAGLSRCATFEHLGLWDQQWDTHASNQVQSDHFELLFEVLCELMASLESTDAPSGGKLIDETTLVVLSEMGRSPKLNGQAGKDHWTYTSALVAGAGVRGGQVVGVFDDYLTGKPIDFATGEATESGSTPSVDDIVATLLAMGDVDPGDFVPNAAPIRAVMSD